MAFTIGGKSFDLRPLTRGEIRQLKKDGILLHRLTMDNVDDAADAVFRIMGLDLSAVDALAYPDFVKLWKEALAETFGSRDEEKNSPTGGAGPPT